VTKSEIDKIIGINISIKEMVSYLTNLGFVVKSKGETIHVSVPSYRANDIDIKEDIAEEIARIYGYHNLPCILMSGALPKPKINLEFAYEKKIKEILVTLGAIEVFNLSLVDKGAIKLKNPLGTDTAYLRDNLKDSLVNSIKSNPQEKGFIHFFELSNIYLLRKNDLPIEQLTLAGIIKNGEYRKAKAL
jgi:phenylalanyl-tRNA synthetase beta chain